MNGPRRRVHDETSSFRERGRWPERAAEDRPDRADERRLVERILRGDVAAERAFYDAHVDRVYRLCHRLSGDDALAQEYTQETFIRAFSRLGGFRGEAALSTWLHAIAVSVTLNGLRKVKRFRARELDLDEARHLRVE